MDLLEPPQQRPTARSRAAGPAGAVPVSSAPVPVDVTVRVTSARPVVVQVQLADRAKTANLTINALKSIEGTDKAVWVYGSNDNQANVQTYAEVLNYDCSRATADRTRISQDANTNEGAPDVAFPKLNLTSFYLWVVGALAGLDWFLAG